MYVAPLAPVPAVSARASRALAALVLLALVAIAAVCMRPAAAQQAVPTLSARVTDLTGTLDPGQRQQLEQELAAIESRKGAQVGVLIVPTTQPETIEQYGIRVAEAWKLGRSRVDGRKVDDGLLILVAKNDRRVRLEVGYGLEGVIPDAIARRIIAETLTPRFRQQDFFGGLTSAVGEIGRLIDGEALPEPWRQGQARSAQGELDLGWFGGIVFGLIAGFIAAAIIGRLFGSMVGAGASGFLAMSGGAPIVIALAIGLVAFFVLLVLTSVSHGMRRVGRHTYRTGPVILPGGWGGGGGGGWGGGSGGGWSGGGGGFGGGGASGDW